MPITQTRSQHQTIQNRLENLGPSIKCKQPVKIKRSALVEINNLNRNKIIAVNSSLKINNQQIEKKPCEQIHKQKVIFKKNEKVNEKKITSADTKNVSIPNKKLIEDIDKLYKENLYLAPDYAEDIYKYLRKLEVKYIINKWPLNKNVTDHMRSTLIDWLVDVHIEYELLQETLHLAIQLIDRYLQISPEITVSNVQLLGVCSMFIATKYEEIQPLNLWDFLYLCNNAYKKEEFLKMENDILIKLDFQIARPTALSFLRRYSLSAKADRFQHLCARYLIDLTLLESTLCHLKPSLVAACAFFISTCLYKGSIDKTHWTEQLEYYSKYRYVNLRPYIGQISKLLLDSGKQFKSVKKKYLCEELDFTKEENLKKACLLRTLGGQRPNVVKGL